MVRIMLASKGMVSFKKGRITSLRVFAMRKWPHRQPWRPVSSLLPMMHQRIGMRLPREEVEYPKERRVASLKVLATKQRPHGQPWRP